MAGPRAASNIGASGSTSQRTCACRPKGTPPYSAILFPLGHEQGAKAHQSWQHCFAGLARRGFVRPGMDPIGQVQRVQMYDEDWHDSKVQAY
jgi:hypothetical protein